MRIFLDANILFSASKSTGSMSRFLDECLKKKHVLVADNYVWSEAEKNLSAKFPEGLDQLTTLKKRCTIVNIPKNSASYNDVNPLLPEKDLPVLISAIEVGCDVLVTGDKKHFGPLYGHVIHGVRILSPAMLFNML
jgi:predicted nucleic acid-binding protein